MRISDWSSDVCSSDLAGRPRRRRPSDERSWPRAERVETGGLPFRRDACLGQLAHRGADPVGDLLQLGSIEVVDVDGAVAQVLPAVLLLDAAERRCHRLTGVRPRALRTGVVVAPPPVSAEAVSTAPPRP